MSAGMIACTVYLNCNFMINFLSFKWQCKSCLEIDDSLQILVKLSFYVAMLKKKQDICISIEQIIDANHWNVEEKYTSMKCLLTKNTRRASS